MTEDLLVVGKSLARVDAWEKAQGRALYAGDMKVPGLIYGKVLRSPWPHAIIKHVEAAKARRVPGVRLVISGDDIPRHKFGPIVPDETILACDKLRFAGEEVAAVAASSEEAAEEALGLIEVQYEELPPVFTPEEALLPGAPKVHDSGNVVFPIQWERGDPDLAFQEADHVFEDRYTTSPVYHASVEPQVCLAAPSGAGGVTIWLPMQDPFMGRRYLAQGLGLEEARVRVIQTTVGGAFGGKRAQRLYVICCLLAMRAGAPVRMLNSRQEDFRSTLVRVPMAIELKTAVNRDGTLLAQEKRILADNGAYCKRAPGVMMAASLTMDNLYRWRSVRTRAQLVYTNKIPTGDFRGFGVPQVAFAVESQMDAIADRLGMDPVDLRLKNATRQGDTTEHGWVVNSCGLDE
ncbi:MAG: molybdopterin-dependent oxidoreductase, partial [Dehalococcoidia bacterium]|nr:molybdopterin-dependent oxidoreductase [Dehalococcoidia bacterium]